jgi:hypothetical protein
VMRGSGLTGRLLVWALRLAARHWRGLAMFSLGALAGGAIG